MSILDFLRGGDDPTKRRHAHTCSACGHTWIHDPDACIGDGATEESCAAVHICPNCGHEERWVDVEASAPEALAAACAAATPGPADPRMGAIPAFSPRMGAVLRGRSPHDPVRVNSEADEYAWLESNLGSPGPDSWQWLSSDRVRAAGRDLDRQAVARGGREESYFFLVDADPLDPRMGALGAAAWDYYVCGGDCPADAPIAVAIPSDQVVAYDAALRAQWAPRSGSRGVIVWRQPTGTPASDGPSPQSVVLVDTRTGRDPRMGASAGWVSPGPNGWNYYVETPAGTSTVATEIGDTETYDAAMRSTYGDGRRVYVYRMRGASILGREPPETVPLLNTLSPKKPMDPYMGAAPDANAGNPLGSLLGLLPEAEKQAGGLLQGAGQQAGTAAGQAAGVAAGQAAQAAVPQVAEAVKAQIPGLAEAMGRAVSPIARQAGQCAGKAAGEAARVEIERERAEVGGTLKTGGFLVVVAAVLGGGAWWLFGRKKKGG